MKKCPYCAEEIQDEAIVCKHCGRDLKPAETAPKPVAAPTKKKVGFLLWMTIAIVLICVVMVVFVQIGGGSGSTKNLDTAAFIMCQDFVKDRLKAPATAKFASITDSKIEPLTGSQWRVTSYVDNQNGFGAMIRTNYVCKIANTGGDQWKLSDLVTE